MNQGWGLAARSQQLIVAFGELWIKPRDAVQGLPSQASMRPKGGNRARRRSGEHAVGRLQSARQAARSIGRQPWVDKLQKGGGDAQRLVKGFAQSSLSQPLQQVASGPRALGWKRHGQDQFDVAPNATNKCGGRMRDFEPLLKPAFTTRGRGRRG